MTDAPDAPDSLARLSIQRGATPVRRRRPLWKRWWVWVVVALLVAAAAQFMRARSAAAQVELATVVAAYPSQSITVLNATGRVVAARRASVSSKGTGRLEWLGVTEGQRVNQGDVIARLENRDVAAQRDQAAASLEAARANLGQGEAEQADADAALRRTQELAQQNFISASAVDTAQARANGARARIATLRAQIGVAEANLRAAGVTFEQTLIRAPFTGMVLTKSANVGDIVTPFSSAAGTTGAVVTMADMATLEVEADVSENSIARIQPGQPTEIQLDAFADLRLLGSVSRIVPTVDRSKATLLVKIRFDETDPRVLPDMSARVAFLSGRLAADQRQPVAAVRPEAIVRRDGKDYVYVVQAATRASAAPADKAGAPGQADVAGKSDAAAKGAASGGRAVLTAVTVGPRVGDLVSVPTLAPGARVVLSPADDLADGRLVTPARK